MKNIKNILKEAGVLLIGAILICSSVAVMATTNGGNEIIDISSKIVTPLVNIEPSFFQGDCVVWDNINPYYKAAYHAQDDPPETAQWDSFPADDFQFDEETDVHWVWWAMCYWNCNYADGPKDYHYDWNITFYKDDGTGNRPGDIYAGPFTIADADIFKSKEVANETGLSYGWWAAYMGVLFSEPVTFLSDTKYWISIYSIGPHYPQSGWYCHNGSYGYPIKLHEGVFKSSQWGYPDWTDFTIVGGEPLDMAFILGGEQLPFEVTLSKGLGVTATIKNHLPANDPGYNQTNISVTFTITGGFVLERTKIFFIEELNASETTTVKFIPLGIGRITIEVFAISQDSAAMGKENMSGLLILFFVI